MSTSWCIINLIYTINNDSYYTLHGNDIYTIHSNNLIMHAALPSLINRDISLAPGQISLLFSIHWGAVAESIERGPRVREIQSLLPGRVK